jgi:hypothetical protein
MAVRHIQAVGVADLTAHEETAIKAMSAARLTALQQPAVENKLPY